MKSTLKNYIICFTLNMLLSTNLYSQIPESYCGVSEISESLNRIPTRSPISGQFFRVLILYVAFSDDESTTSWNIWPPHQKPVNPYTNNGRFIDTSEMSNFTDYTYSKWFQEMNRDSFDFIGDEVYVDLPLSAEQYRSQGYGYGQMNEIVLNRIDSLINYERYDNWKVVNNEWVWGKDGNVDFVIMNYRYIPVDTAWFFGSHGTGGLDNIGTSLTLDSNFIHSGITAVGLLNRLTRTQVIVLHEVCHYLLNHTSLGLMTPGHAQSTYHLSPQVKS